MSQKNMNLDRSQNAAKKQDALPFSNKITFGNKFAPSEVPQNRVLLDTQQASTIANQLLEQPVQQPGPQNPNQFGEFGGVEVGDDDLVIKSILAIQDLKTKQSALCQKI